MTVSPVSWSPSPAASCPILAPDGAEMKGELSLRAVIAGCGIGGVLAIGNVYMGLKTGWGDQGNLTASILGFALFAALRGWIGQGYTLLENNITQTVASSAASMSFGIGLVGAFPALSMLGQRYPPWAMAVWGMALGGIGIFLGNLLRDRLIVSERLPFPSGVATAEVIQAMHGGAPSALHRARALLASAAAAASVVWVRDRRPAFIPQLTTFRAQILGLSGESLTLGVNWSPLLLGTGMLIGPRNGLSLLAGALAAWLGLAPLALHRGWVDQADFSHLSSWLLWPGVALLTSGALASLALQWATVGRGLKDLVGSRRALARGGSAWAALSSAAFIMLLGWAVFRIHPGLTLGALAASVLLASVCARATGETDIAPLTQMGQVTQLMVGGVAPGQWSGNVLAGGVASGVATQTSLTLWSLKAGQLLGADRHRQLWGQWIGMFAGAVVVVPAYQLVVSAYGLGNQRLPAPAAVTWKAIAELVQGGLGGLPASARVWLLVAAALGIALSLLDRTRWSRFLPSAVALSVGFLVPASYAVTIAAGSLLLALAQWLGPSWCKTYGAPIASGTIAGESLAGVLIALMIAVGLLDASP